MENINDYDVKLCQEFCKQLPFFDQITQDFDQLNWNKLWNVDLIDFIDDRHIVDSLITPRQRIGSRWPPRTTFSMVPFFYLQKLLETHPKTIYDLGAGWNIFKKYLPNVIGVSPTTTVDNFSDVQGIIDQDYVNGHQDYFESVFSINALHFRPLNELKNTIEEFASMVKPTGRGFLALNLAPIVECTPVEFLVNKFGSAEPTMKDYDHYIRDVLSKINLNYLIVDVDLSVFNEWLDGNIRLVFEK